MRVDSMIEWFIDKVLTRYARKHREFQVNDSRTSVTRSVKYDQQFCGLPRRVQAHLQKRLDDSKVMRCNSVQPMGDDETMYTVQGVGGTYRVDLKHCTCSCPDFRTHRSTCKHIFKVLTVVKACFSSLAFKSRPWLTIEKQAVHEGASKRSREKLKEVRASLRLVRFILYCVEY